MKKPINFITLVLFSSMALFCELVFAHGGEIEVTNGAKGPVTLTDAQVKAINLQLAPVSQQPVAQTLVLNGTLQAFPNEQADVSVRISGQVTELYVNLGDSVKKDQPLAKVQSRLVGDPPPSVVITAPLAGIIDARNVNVGQAVDPNTVLFHISNRASMVMYANVYEEDLGKVSVGQKARITVLSYPNTIFEGQVTRIEPNLDPLTRTVKIWITLDNAQNLLKPNLFGKAEIILKENTLALTIPTVALLEANGETFVFVADNNLYYRTLVKTGVSENSYTEITEGLDLADKVVTQGNRQVYTLWLTGSNNTSTKPEGH